MMHSGKLLILYVGLQWKAFKNFYFYV